MTQQHITDLAAYAIKSGHFKPEYAGKMNFYLNLLDDYVREPHENPSIGIMLCYERKIRLNFYKFEGVYYVRK